MNPARKKAHGGFTVTRKTARRDAVGGIVSSAVTRDEVHVRSTWMDNALTAHVVLTSASEDYGCEVRYRESC
jgi:hypothetical protein